MFDETLKIAEDKKFREENIQEDWTWGYIDEPIYKYRGGRLGSLSNEN